MIFVAFFISFIYSFVRFYFLVCGIIHLCVAITYNSFVSFVIFGFITLYDRFCSPIYLFFSFVLLLWLIHYSHGFHFAKMLVNTDKALLLL